MYRNGNIYWKYWSSWMFMSWSTIERFHFNSLNGIDTDLCSQKVSHFFNEGNWVKHMCRVFHQWRIHNGSIYVTHLQFGAVSDPFSLLYELDNIRQSWYIQQEEEDNGWNIDRPLVWRRSNLFHHYGTCDHVLVRKWYLFWHFTAFWLRQGKCYSIWRKQ